MEMELVQNNQRAKSIALSIAVIVVIGLSYFAITMYTFELSFSHMSLIGIKTRFANILRGLVVLHPAVSIGIGVGAHLGNIASGRVFSAFSVLPAVNAMGGLMVYYLFNKGNKSFGSFAMLLTLYAVIFGFATAWAVAVTIQPHAWLDLFKGIMWLRVAGAIIGTYPGLLLYRFVRDGSS